MYAVRKTCISCDLVVCPMVLQLHFSRMGLHIGFCSNRFRRYFNEEKYCSRDCFQAFLCFSGFFKPVLIDVHLDPSSGLLMLSVAFNTENVVETQKCQEVQTFLFIRSFDKKIRCLVILPLDSGLSP